MLMKRCFELSVSSSMALVGRAMLVGSVLSFATACAHRDAAKSDSTVASADSATTVTTATVTPASAVESISTGETALHSDSSRAAPAAAVTASASAAKPATTPATTPKPVHHAAAHAAPAAPATRPSTTASVAAPAAAPVANTAAAAAADTGEKTGADTSKKTAAAGTDKLLVDSATYEGWKIFASNCFRCHGEDAMGGTFAPNLRHSLGPEGGITHDLFIQTVTNGRPAKGMPSWGSTYTREQFEQIYKYLMARSTGALAPGRPHRASDLKPRTS